MRKSFIISIFLFFFFSTFYNKVYGSELYTTNDTINLQQDNIFLVLEKTETNDIVISMILKNMMNKEDITSLSLFHVIFKATNNTISQFYSSEVLKDNPEDFEFKLIGNKDFFIKNYISQILIKHNSKEYNIIVSNNISQKIYNYFNKVKREKERIKKTKYDFNRISLGYDVMFLKPNFKTMNGINLQYVHGFRIAKIPFYIELGLDISYNILNNYTARESFTWNPSRDEFYYGTDRLNSLSVRIPINLSYKFKLGSKFLIQPYTGFNFKINPLFNEYSYNKYKADIIPHNNYDIYRYESYSEAAGNKLFQFGWQIGLGFNIDDFYLGLQYGIDFKPRAIINTETNKEEYYNDYYLKSESYKTSSYNLKSTRLLISLGYNF